jgi:hypothetical protein
MICHFTNKNRVFQLFEKYKEKGIHYDCVISLRIDLVFSNNFILDNLEDNTIYIPDGRDYRDGINDQIAYGKIDVMKKHNSISPVELLEKGLSYPHPETLHYANLKFNNIQIKRVNLEYKFDK